MLLVNQYKWSNRKGIEVDKDCQFSEMFDKWMALLKDKLPDFAAWCETSGFSAVPDLRPLDKEGKPQQPRNQANKEVIIEDDQDGSVSALRRGSMYKL